MPKPNALSVAEVHLRLGGRTVLDGLSLTAAFAAVTYAFSATTHTSIVAVLSSTFSLPTLVLARLFLRERLATTQKLAAGVIITGIALVSIH